MNRRPIIHTDVLVVGGGVAGVFAAISAARTGVKVLLIERSCILGGTATNADVCFPGLFYAWGKQIISGPCWESIVRTVDLGAGEMPVFLAERTEKHWEEQIRMHHGVYAGVLYQMCMEAGVELLTNTMLSSLEDRPDGVEGYLTDKEGLVGFSARVAIDATGDANLTSIAGYAVQKSRIQQPATLQNHLSGYDYESIDLDGIKALYNKGIIPPYVPYNSFLSYLKRHILDIHIPCTDAHTSQGRTKLETDARALLIKLLKALRGVRGLEKIMLDYVADETGVRESLRIVGEYEMTADEYVQGVVYPDAISYAFYQIDLHIMTGIKVEVLKKGILPTISYRSLIPKGSRHLLTAGRCISSDTDTNSAIRVQAVCMSVGQAAGVAAALCVQNRLFPVDVPYRDLVTGLKALGAIVPPQE